MLKQFSNSFRSPFNLPICYGEIETPINASERFSLNAGIGVILSVLTYLIFNPFVAICILTFYSLLIDESIQKTKPSLFVFTIALSLFYANRDIVPLAGDDVVVYERLFSRDQELGLADIFSRFFLSPPNNEILYFASAWLIGKVINTEIQTLMFMVYFGQLALLSVIAYLVSKRYAVVFLFIFFLGISDPGPHIIHIWRASLGSFVFMIGMLLYFKGDPITGRIIVLASLGFHLSLLLFVLIFEFYIVLRKRWSLFVTFLIGALAFYIVTNFFQLAMETFIPVKVDLFFDVERKNNLTELFFLIILLAGNYYFPLSPAARFATFSFLVYFILGLGLDSISSFMTRLGQIAFPLAAIPIFEIVMKCPKLLISTICCLLLIRSMIRPVTDFYSLLLPQYRDPFYGLLNILYATIEMPSFLIW